MSWAYAIIVIGLMGMIIEAIRGHQKRIAEIQTELDAAILQERSTSSDIPEFTHQLSVMEDRLVELREEDELEESRQRHFDGDEDSSQIDD